MGRRNNQLATARRTVPLALRSLTMPNEISQLLLNWSEGDASAREQLLPLVYDELRQLARRYLSHERANHIVGNAC